MHFLLGSRSIGSRLLTILCVAGVLAGCTKQQSSEQALDKQYSDNPQFKRTPMAKFAGKVTVDGQPPANGFRLFVILNDPSHLEVAAHSQRPPMYARCDENGNFSFTTINKNDGVPIGKYVVTFVEFRDPDRASGGHMRGPKFRGGAGLPKYEGSDELKNLYNDPDKNAKDEKQFVLDLQSPGKTDYQFDLTVAGKEPIATPGANAVTSIGGGR
jgi:hypothetical protein